MAVAKTNVASSCQLSPRRLQDANRSCWDKTERSMNRGCGSSENSLILRWNVSKYESIIKNTQAVLHSFRDERREREKKNCAFQQLSGVSKLAAHPPSGSTSREQVLDKNNKLTHKVYTETWYIDTVQKVSVQMSACNYEPSKAEEYRNMATFPAAIHGHTHSTCMYLMYQAVSELAFSLSWQLKTLCLRHVPACPRVEIFQERMAPDEFCIGKIFRIFHECPRKSWATTVFIDSLSIKHLYMSTLPILVQL